MKTKEEYLQIKKYIEQRNININNSYANIEDKIIFLDKVMGYKNLRVGSNTSGYAWIPINQCKEGRISSVVKKIYLDATKHLKEKKFKSIDDYIQGELNFKWNIQQKQKKLVLVYF